MECRIGRLARAIADLSLMSRSFPSSGSSTALRRQDSTALQARSSSRTISPDHRRDGLERTEIAGAQNVPPYVIFHDHTLIELAAARPASRAEMAEVPGVGDAKMDRYGPAFLAVIAEHAG